MEELYEEYRAELQKMISGVDSNQMLHDFYTYAARHIICDKSVDNRDSVLDYGDMIIGMVLNIGSQGKLEYLYTFLKLFLEKWG